VRILPCPEVDSTVISCALFQLELGGLGKAPYRLRLVAISGLHSLRRTYCSDNDSHPRIYKGGKSPLFESASSSSTLLSLIILSFIPFHEFHDCLIQSRRSLTPLQLHSTIFEMFSLRSLFKSAFRSNKKKYAEARFPPNWPSYLHSKCSIATCAFPNPPRAAEGTYSCQGAFGRQRCPGTFHVSPSMARSLHQANAFQNPRQASTKPATPVRPPRPAHPWSSGDRPMVENRALPHAPSLDLRKVQPRSVNHTPRFAPPAPQPAANLCYPLYPTPVQSHYAPAASYRYDIPRTRRHHMNCH
jgi:hypothetical protein